MKLIVYNRSGTKLILVLEPSAVAYEVGTGNSVQVEGNFIEEAGNMGEIEVSPNNVLSLYLKPGASVLEDGEPAKRAPGW